MKEAVNQFSKGLITDYNPLLVSNDTLTDALNATFITMNGNEVMLQNDMGNARVETAFLPSGYVPVGVKEYGGIIYIASHNPITGKSQVGSFPSPERNFDSKEDISQESIEFQENNECTFYEKQLLFNGRRFRPGDKFAIYITEGTLDSESISNCNNVTRIPENTENRISLVTSPQNRRITYSVKAEDSSNNLVDITNQLKRFDSNGNYIEYDETDTSLIKFNDGYFIRPDLEHSENQNLIVERDNKLNLNVYKNKWSGKLYLVKEYNVIDHIDVTFNISRKNNSEDKYDITIDVIYYYNCPDGFYCDNQGNIKLQSSEESQAKPIIIYDDDDDYMDSNKAYRRPISGNTDWDDWVNENYSQSNTLQDGDEEEQDTNNGKFTAQFEQKIEQIPKYDISTNLYSYKNRISLTLDNNKFGEASVDVPVIKDDNNIITIPENYKYLFPTKTTGCDIEGCNVDFTLNGSNLECKITPKMTYSCPLTTLSQNFNIDLTKVGTNTIEIDTWKWYTNNNDNTLTLNAGFNVYPNDDHYLDNITIKMIDWTHFKEDQQPDPITDFDNKLESDDKLNGFKEEWVYCEIKENKNNFTKRFVISEESGSNQLKPDTIYYCYIYYTFKTSTGESKERLHDTRWIITTNIYNRYYNEFSDFCSDTAENGLKSERKLKLKLTSDSTDTATLPEETSLFKYYVNDDKGEEIPDFNIDGITQWKQLDNINELIKYSQYTIVEFPNAISKLTYRLEIENKEKFPNKNYLKYNEGTQTIINEERIYGLIKDNGTPDQSIVKGYKYINNRDIFKGIDKGNWDDFTQYYLTYCTYSVDGGDDENRIFKINKLENINNPDPFTISGRRKDYLVKADSDDDQEIFLYLDELSNKISDGLVFAFLDAGNREDHVFTYHDPMDSKGVRGTRGLCCMMLKYDNKIYVSNYAIKMALDRSDAYITPIFNTEKNPILGKLIPKTVYFKESGTLQDLPFYEGGRHSKDIECEPNEYSTEIQGTLDIEYPELIGNKKRADKLKFESLNNVITEEFSHLHERILDKLNEIKPLLWQSSGYIGFFDNDKLIALKAENNPLDLYDDGGRPITLSTLKYSKNDDGIVVGVENSITKEFIKCSNRTNDDGEWVILKNRNSYYFNLFDLFDLNSHVKNTSTIVYTQFDTAKFEENYYDSQYEDDIDKLILSCFKDSHEPAEYYEYDDKETTMYQLNNYNLADFDKDKETILEFLENHALIDPITKNQSINSIKEQLSKDKPIKHLVYLKKPDGGVLELVKETYEYTEEDSDELQQNFVKLTVN